VDGLSVSPRWLVTLLFLGAHCGSAVGANLNDVAMTMVELPEEYSEVIPTGLDFSPDGNYLAVRSDNNKINIWDWRKRRIYKTIETPGGAEAGVANPIRYSPDGRFFVHCDTSGAGHVAVRIWNTESWSVAKELIAGPGLNAGGCTDAAFTPDGELFVRTSDQGVGPGENLIAYSVATWQRVWGLEWKSFKPISLAVNPQGRSVAIGGYQIIVPWEISDPIKRARGIKREPQITIVDLREHRATQTINGDVMGPMAWSPDGEIIVVVGTESVESFDSRTGSRRSYEHFEKGEPLNVRFTPNGKFLFESYSSYSNGDEIDRGVRIWDSQRKRLLQQLSGKPGSRTVDTGSLAASKDSKFLAVGNRGRTTIWEFK
jgi:WD40 repeat protein